MRKHMFKHGFVHVVILDSLHMLTHANIEWSGCSTIVVHVAVSSTTWSAIHTSLLQRITSRVTPSKYQISGVNPISENKKILSCI